MARPGSTLAIIIAALILLLGIIHLAVASSIVGKYNKYSEVFRQVVGLAAFNIVIGIFGIAVGIVSLVVVIREIPSISKNLAISSGILGIFALISLIVALILNSQAIGYIRTHLTFRVDSYLQTQSSNNIVNALQNKYQCCGVNLWLDWAQVGLDGTLGATTNTGSTIGKRSLDARDDNSQSKAEDQPPSMLRQSMRRRRQTTVQSGYYGLPTTYSVALPLSCCTNGATVAAESVGGYCMFNAANGTSGFYLEGCIVPVANAAVSNIMGIGVINTCLIIVAFVLLPALINMFPEIFDSNKPNTKQPLSDESRQGQMQQQLPQSQVPVQQMAQYPTANYYAGPYDQNTYYTYNTPAYPVYTVYQ